MRRDLAQRLYPREGVELEQAKYELERWQYTESDAHDWTYDLLQGGIFSSFASPVRYLRPESEIPTRTPRHIGGACTTDPLGPLGECIHQTRDDVRDAEVHQQWLAYLGWKPEWDDPNPLTNGALWLVDEPSVYDPISTGIISDVRTGYSGADLSFYRRAVGNAGNSRCRTPLSDPSKGVMLRTAATVTRLKVGERYYLCALADDLTIRVGKSAVVPSLIRPMDFKRPSVEVFSVDHPRKAW